MLLNQKPDILFKNSDFRFSVFIIFCNKMLRFYCANCRKFIQFAENKFKLHPHDCGGKDFMLKFNNVTVKIKNPWMRLKNKTSHAKLTVSLSQSQNYPLPSGFLVANPQNHHDYFFLTSTLCKHTSPRNNHIKMVRNIESLKFAY